MAKKIDFNLDDFDFDKEFENMDFNFDSAEVKDDRNPVTKVASGFAKSAKSTFASEPFIVSSIKNLLPRGYGSTADAVLGTRDNIRDLYNSSAEEIRPVINDLKKTVGKAVPSASRYMPGGLAKKLEKWAQTYEEEPNTYSYNDSNEDEINRNIAEVFKLQSQAQDIKDQEREYKDQLSEGLAFTKHRESLGVLNQMRLSLSQLTSYQDKITANYQRKSLELQYRQFFLAKDAYIEQKRANAELRSYLESINKNTALPDYVKLKQSERLGEALRNRFINEGIQGFFGDRTSFIKNVGTRLRGRLEGNLKQFTSGVRDGLSAAEMGLDAMQMMRDSGMSEDPYVSAGGFIGSAAPSFIAGSRYGNRLRDFLAKNPGISKVGNQLQYHLQNLPGYANQYARSSSGSFGPFSFLINPLKEAILGENTSHHIDVDNIKNLHQPSVFTRQTNKSINEIIPGLLSRIHNELQIIRTGDSSIEPISYDFVRNKFDNTSTIRKNLLNSVVNNNTRSMVTSDLESLIDEIDPQKKLNKEARELLGRQLLTDNMHGRLGTPERLTKESIYKNGSEKYASQYSELFRNYFENDDSYSKRAKFSERFNDLGRFIDVDKELLQNIVNAGQQKYLADAGILSLGGVESTDPTGYINKDNYFNYFFGKNITDPKKHNLSSVNKNVYSFNDLPPVNRHYTDVDNNQQTNLFNNTSNFNSESIIDIIKEHSPIELLKAANETLVSIDTKLSSGLPFYDLSKVDPEAFKNGLLKDLVSDPNKKNGILKDTYLLSRRIVDRSLGRMKGFSKFVTGKVDIVKDNVGKTAGLFGSMVDKVIGRGKELTDVYVGRDIKPRLEAWKLKAGMYFDETTGKVITNFKDIKGNVLDENGEIVLKAEDLKHAYSNTKNGIKSLYTLGVEKSTGLLSSITSRLRALDLTKTGLFSINRNILINKTKDVYDVYVAGKLDPILLQWKLKAGYYTDSITGKVITSFNDIKGDVLDEEGKIVATIEDLKKAYTKTTSGLKPFSLIKKFSDTASEMGSNLLKNINRVRQHTSTNLKKGKDWLFNKPNPEKASDGSGDTDDQNKSNFEKGTSGLFKLGKGGLGLLGKAGGFIGQGVGEGIRNFSNFFLGGLGTVFRGKRIENQLIRIYELLDERLAGKKIRKGSYEDQMNQKKEDEENKSVDEKVNQILGSSWNGSIYGMGAAGIGGLINKFRNKDGSGKESDKEDSDSGLTEAVIGGAAGSLLGKFGKAAKWGLKKLPKLGGLGLAGMGAYSMYENGFDIIDAGSVATGLTLMAPKMMGTAALGLGKGLLAAGGALMSAVSAPVLIGAAAIGTAGYFGYKYFTRRKPELLSTIRYAQYGFLTGDDDKFRKILQFEDILLEMVTVSGTSAQIDVNKFQKKINTIAKLFGVDQSDQIQLANWSNWYVNRFRPIFLQHVGALNTINSNVKITDVDKGLSTEEKLKYLDSVTIDPNSYSVNVSPFPGDDVLPATSRHIETLTLNAKKELSENDEKDKKGFFGGLMSAIGLGKETSPKLDAEDINKEPSTSDTKVSGLSLLSKMNPFTAFLPSIKVLGDNLFGFINPKIGDITKLRMLQYGFSINDTELAKKVIILDKLIYPYIKNIDSNPKLDITDKKTLNEIYEVFGINTKDELSLYRFTDWLNKRYAKVLVEHIKAFKAINKPIDFVNVDSNLSMNEKFAYVNVAASDTMVYEECYSPFGNDKRIENNKEAITAFKERFIETTKSTGSVEETLLEEEGKTGFFSKAKSFFSGIKDKLFGKSKDEVEITPDMGKGIGGAFGNIASSGISQDVSTSNAPNLTVNAGSVPTKTNINDVSGGKLSSTPSKGQKLTEAQVAKMAMDAGITDKTELAMFMAQTAHESMGFKKLKEDLRYSPERLYQVFGKYGRVKSLEHAREIVAGGPKMIADTVYAHLGGYNYIGRGLIQLTGKRNYDYYGKVLGLDLHSNPDLISDDPVLATKATIEYWKHTSGLRKAAQAGDVVNTSSIINKGKAGHKRDSINGIKDRENRFAKYMKMDLGGLAEGAAPIGNNTIESDTSTTANTSINFKDESSSSNQSKDSGSLTPLLSSLSNSGSSGNTASVTPLLDELSSKDLSNGKYNGSVVDTGKEDKTNLSSEDINNKAAATVNPLLSKDPVETTTTPDTSVSAGGYTGSVKGTTDNTAIVTQPTLSVVPNNKVPEPTYNGFNPIASNSARDLALQQKQNALDNNAVFTPLHDSMKESVAIGREHLDISKRSLEALITIAELLRGDNTKGNNESNIDRYKNRSELESKLYTDTKNTPVSLAKKYA